MFPASILVALCAYAILLQSAQGQDSAAACKCGGEYANGRKVTGCVSDACNADAQSSKQCVTIYRDQQPIGYDCVPWASQVANCATYDDGSRVCANNVCKPNLLGGKEGDCALANDDDWHAVVAVQINKAGLDFALKAVPAQVQKIVDNLTIPDQKMSSAALDFSAWKIAIKDFVMPEISYEFVPPSSIRVHLRGGDFGVSASWEAKKFFLKMNGDISAWSKDHKGINLDLLTTITVSPTGVVQVGASECKYDGNIDLKLNGAVGAVVGTITNFITNLAQSKIYSKICGVIDTQMQTTVKSKLEALPTQIKINDQFGAKFSIRSIAVTDSSLNVQVAASATFNDSSSATIAPHVDSAPLTRSIQPGESAVLVHLGSNSTVTLHGDLAKAAQ